MPPRAGRVCAHPGCSEITRKHYCEVHTPQGNVYKGGRGSAAARGYDANWRKVRRMKLNQDPVCVDPEGRHPGKVVAATEVDHIIPLVRGGSKGFENLQSLCHTCHSHKTATQDGGWGGRGGSL